MKLSRRERKKQAETKRQHYRIEIHKIMKAKLEKGASIEEACRAADSYINRQIDINPQESDLILQVAWGIKADLEKFFKELQNATK